jgi:hypothetical protein
MLDYFEPEIVAEIVRANLRFPSLLIARDQSIRKLVLSVLLYILLTRNISLSRV